MSGNGGTGGPIDLNNASKEELDAIEALRGHGPEIVRYREERGGFTSIDQLEEVPGLTGKIDTDLSDQISIGG